MNTKRFLGLDGLRGVCALTVVFFHCNNFFHSGAFFQHGFLSVDVFFIISGFVMSLTYDQKLASGLTKKAFLASRARRLFPTYWLGVAFNVAVFIVIAKTGIIAANDSWWMIWLIVPLFAFLLIPDFITSEGMLYPATENVSWSLFVEWGAYIAYAKYLFRCKTKLLVFIVITGWCAMTVAGYFTHVGWCVGADRSTFWFGPLRCAPAFAVGMILYRIHDQPFFQRLPVISTELLLAAWLCIAVLPTYTATPTLDAIIVVFLSPVLAGLLVRANHKAPAFCSWLGDLSYPLYVVHPGLMLLAAYTPVFGLSHGPKPLNAVVLIVACLLLAWLVGDIAKRIAGSRFSFATLGLFGKIRSAQQASN